MSLANFNPSFSKTNDNKNSTALGTGFGFPMMTRFRVPEDTDLPLMPVPDRLFVDWKVKVLH
jgi:hypothetical protein